MYNPEGERIVRTNGRTFSAADALRAVRRPRDVYAHAACPRACAAFCTFFIAAEGDLFIRAKNSLFKFELDAGLQISSASGSIAAGTG